MIIGKNTMTVVCGLLLVVIIMLKIDANRQRNILLKSYEEDTISLQNTIDELTDSNVMLADSTDSLLSSLQGWKLSLNKLQDSINVVNKIKYDIKHTEIINSTNSSNVKQFNTSIAKYKDRFNINIRR